MEMPLMSATRKASATPHRVVSGMRSRRAARSGRVIIGLLLSGAVDGGSDGLGLIGCEAFDDGPGGYVDPLPHREIGEDKGVRASEAAVGLHRRTMRIDPDDAARRAQTHRSRLAFDA